MDFKNKQVGPVSKRAGENIRRIRRRINLTQGKLGAASGLQTNTISMVERGLTRVTADHLEALAPALGVSISSLFDVED